MHYIYQSREKLDELAAKLMADKINQSENEVITLSLPGGRSVIGIFQQLLKQDINWYKTHVFLTDERIVPLNHQDSNFRQLNDTLITVLLKSNLLAQSNIHPFPGENQNIDQAVNNYSQELISLGGQFDIVLLSAGEDGHVASLFPDHASVKDESDYYFSLEDSPKPPARRISISRNLLLRSKMAILLFYGKSKLSALKNFHNRKFEPASCPAKYLNQIEDSYLLTDQKVG